REHGDAVTARIDGQYVPAVDAHRPLGIEIAPGRRHEAATAGGEGRARHLGERAVVIAGKDDDAVTLTVVVEGVSVAGGAGDGRARPGELDDAERRRDEERENGLHDAFPPWLVSVDEIAPGVDVRGAVAKFTLKRLHQIVTAR